MYSKSLTTFSSHGKSAGMYSHFGRQSQTTLQRKNPFQTVLDQSMFRRTYKEAKNNASFDVQMKMTKKESEHKRSFVFQLSFRFTTFKVFDTFKTFASTWKEMRSKPSPIGKLIWENPNQAKIVKEVTELHNKDGKKGIIGFHCTVYKEEMLQQALSNPEGTIEYRENDHGEGLYVGSAEGAAHFGGQKGGWIFRVASTSSIATNSDYGTQTTYLSGPGKVYVLSIYHLNPEFHDYRMPWPWEILFKSMERSRNS